MQKLLVDTAVTVRANVQPATSDSDFKTINTTLAYTDMTVYWHFETVAGVKTRTQITPTTAGDYDWSHIGGAYYKIEIPATHATGVTNDAEGYGFIEATATGVLPMRGPTYEITTANIANSLVTGTDYLHTDILQVDGADVGTATSTVQANLIEINGSTAPVDHLEDAYDGTGYNVGGGSIVASSVTGGVGGSVDSVTDPVSVTGGSGSTLRQEVERLAGIDQGSIHGSDLLFALEADETHATWPSRPQVIGGTWYMMYTAEVDVDSDWRIRLKTSSDSGETWTGATDILQGTAGEWDADGVWCPNFWLEDGTYYLMYTGFNATTGSVYTGLATASTVDGTYTKHASNPVVDPDLGDFRMGSAELTGIMKVSGTYYGYFCNIMSTLNNDVMNTQNRKVWYQTTDDLITWSEPTVIFGDDDTSQVRQPGIGYYSASPFVCVGRYYLIVARYGPFADFSQFELWEDNEPTFSRETRRFVKTLLTTQDLGTWPDHEVDIGHIAITDIDCSIGKTDAAWFYFGAKHNRSGTRTWETGLMKYDSFYELVRPAEPIVERVIDRLPQTRWNYGALDALLEGNVTEDYAAQGASAFTGQQMWNEMLQCIVDRAQSELTMTTYQRDGTTQAVTYTLDDATSPAKIARDQS